VGTAYHRDGRHLSLTPSGQDDLDGVAGGVHDRLDAKSERSLPCFNDTKK
jgi:hypothetical protein